MVWKTKNRLSDGNTKWVLLIGRIKIWQVWPQVKKLKSQLFSLLHQNSRVPIYKFHSEFSRFLEKLYVNLGRKFTMSYCMTLTIKNNHFDLGWHFKKYFIFRRYTDRDQMQTVDSNWNYFFKYFSSDMRGIFGLLYARQFVAASQQGIRQVTRLTISTTPVRNDTVWLYLFRLYLVWYLIQTSVLNPWSKYYNEKCEFLKESRACEKDCYKFGTTDCREKCETKHDCINCMDEHAKCVSNCPCHSGCPDGCPCRHWPCDDDETHDDSQLLILDTKNRQSILFRRVFKLMLAR